MIEKAARESANLDQSHLDDKEMAENSLGRPFRLAEGSPMNKDLLNASQGIKSMLFKDNSSAETLKNLRNQVFSFQTNSTGNDRRGRQSIALKGKPASLLDLQSNLQLNGAGSRVSTQVEGGPQLSGTSPNSKFEGRPGSWVDTIQKPADSLGKRREMVPSPDPEVLYNDPFYTSKRRQPEGAADSGLSSPSHQNNYIRLTSGSASPSHSFGGGFKLHSSRKDSGLNELDDLRMSPKPTGFGSTTEGN
jgi:hypothetical protein